MHTQVFTKGKEGSQFADWLEAAKYNNIKKKISKTTRRLQKLCWVEKIQKKAKAAKHLERLEAVLGQTSTKKAVQTRDYKSCVGKDSSLNITKITKHGKKLVESKNHTYYTNTYGGQ